MTRTTQRHERRSVARRIGRQLLVLANRAPFRHEFNEAGDLRRVCSASGVVTAIEPLLFAAGGTWIAHGDPADLASGDNSGRVRVKSGRAAYDVRYVGVPAIEYRAFYEGFANEALWPLCHTARVTPMFRAFDFAQYQSANRRFAASVINEASSASPIVFVQDYHFALAPLAIRRGLPSSTIASFWHIPWPDARRFRTCPWSEQLLYGLLGSDVVGLQTEDDCDRFLDSVALLTDYEVVRSAGVVIDGSRSIQVRAYPVGVPRDPDLLSELPSPDAAREQIVSMFDVPSDGAIIVGVDRMDYTKGVPEKIRAIERLLERRPELRGKVVLLQVAEPSRGTLDAYRDIRCEALAVSDRVNRRFGQHGYQPIRLLERHFDPIDVYRLYRAADVCFVNSLHDGMNLVAKEFVTARCDEQGVLVLSQLAGASRQLPEALPVNPYAVEGSARTLEQALLMDRKEQRERMRALRRTVLSTDSTWWANRLLEDAVQSSVQSTVASTSVSIASEPSGFNWDAL